jgi:hypothetical protein
VQCAELKTCNYTSGKKYYARASFSALHHHAKPVNFGVDKASVTLGNGWRLEGMDYQWNKKQDVIVGLPQGFKKRANQFTIKMPWTSWNGGAAAYGVKLLACGPWGVPY